METPDSVAANRQELAPEDAAVLAEALRRVRDAVASLVLRADGCVNHRDLYEALEAEYAQALKETETR